MKPYALNILTALMLCTASTHIQAKDLIKVLIVDGQNNHDWPSTTPALKKILEEASIFQVDVATSPSEGQDLSAFAPEFSKYAAVITNYNGDIWPEKTRQSCVDYIRNGGGLVVIHAADNSFPGWKEYNDMIGLGGWNGRDEKCGPYIRWRDGKFVRDLTPGVGGSHGPQHEIQTVIRSATSPITAGLPEKWMHGKDEIYNRLRGPAKNMTVLATALTPLDKGGTGEHEPMLFTVEYGQGRVFHDAYGHDASNMECVGFIYTLQRGTEWAATGKVTLTEVPKDFPGPDKASYRSLK